MSDGIDLSGQAAVVTGSSRGIGAAILTALSRAGARCVLNYIADDAGRNKAEAEAVAAGLSDVTLIDCDVGDAQAVGGMMDRIGRELGGLDILVNNAGILRDRSLKKMTHDDWDAVLRVNLTGAFHCIQAAVPLLRPGGRIVNVASLSGAVGIFGQANYAASKAGLIALTRVAATELARQQVTVNAVAPGVVATEMGRAIPEEARRQLLGQVPLGRFGSTRDIADLVLFLCSGRAGYITGQTIHINGGMHMH